MCQRLHERVRQRLYEPVYNDLVCAAFYADTDSDGSVEMGRAESGRAAGAMRRNLGDNQTSM